MEGAFEDKVLGTLLFIDSISKRELAEFIVNQGEAINGLQRNNSAFVKAFRELYSPNEQIKQTSAAEPSCLL